MQSAGQGRVSCQEIWRAGLAQVGGVLAEKRAGHGGVVQVAAQVDHPAVQRMGDVDQPREADPVEAALILLDLLEGQADRIGERRLRHAQGLATLTNTQAQRHVEPVGRLGAIAGNVFGRRPWHVRFLVADEIAAFRDGEQWPCTERRDRPNRQCPICGLVPMSAFDPRRTFDFR